MKEVVIVGTVHPIQRDLSRVDFANYLNELFECYGLDSIAEEIDHKPSNVQSVSDIKKCEYVNIEPSESERELLGIVSLACIEHQIIMDFDDPESLEALAKKDELKHDVFRLREREWLNRMSKMAGTKILVVCGNDHVEPFAKLLNENNYKVTVADAFLV